MKWTKREIREQLNDLGAFRSEVLDGHRQHLDTVRAQLAEAEEAYLKASRDARSELEGIETEHLEQMKRLERATAEWSVRAAEAGMSEGEVLELLGLPRPTDVKRRPWNAENPRHRR